MDSFDYIIVGGGSGGSALASRLSEDPSVSVCVIETGGSGKQVTVRAPAAVVINLNNKKVNYSFETVPQPGLNGRKGYQPRGRGLGGSSAINAMLYVRGHPGDYDDWEALGNPGWGWKDVLPYFMRSEGNRRGKSDLHNDDGPLVVSDLRSPNPHSSLLMEAARELQLPVNDDFNGQVQEGVGHYQVTQKDGERWSAAAAYLHPHMDRPNLTVLTDTLAERVLIENKSTTGVQIRQRGKSRPIKAEREVILCSGAFGSPQLLMLSGIGSSSHLKEHGIELVADLPGVGQNLQDHIDYVLVYKSPSKEFVGISLTGIKNLISGIFQWRKDGSGMISTPFAESGGFLKTDPTLDRPDVQLHFVIAMVDDHSRKMHMGHGYSCHVCVLRPKSRGEVKLNSADAADAPLIDPAFLSHEEDMEVLKRGVRLTHRLMEAPAFAKVRGKNLYNEPVEDDAALERLIRDRADTVYHPVGTCKMGNDPMAVVDHELRVRGIAGLRVADASIMPTLIGGNTNAPSIMIGEKCADMIRNNSKAIAAE